MGWTQPSFLIVKQRHPNGGLTAAKCYAENHRTCLGKSHMEWGLQSGGGLGELE